MASLPLCSSTTASHLPCRHTFFGAPPHFPPPKTRTHHHLLVSCNSQNEETPKQKIDRRNLLLGVGGVYGAVNLDSSALATPITGPDFDKCTRGVNLNMGNTPLDVNCCPPLSLEITDYELPPVECVRFRPAAHLVTKEYIAKYEKAVALMKALPHDDPRNFHQQANIHCAYCNLTYEQTGDPDEKLQIHFCWHFFPWHRCYMYFYERILGKLIDDPTFGLPFWNWDNYPPAPYMPPMYVNEKSPLYNCRRNPDHLWCALADLKYTKSVATPPEKILASNLTEMYGEMIRNAKTLEDFYGARYVVGTPPSPGAGSVERGSHTAMHVWVGEDTPEGLDMGNFYSTGRESLFYAHHTNIDRLWSLWRDLRGPRPKDFQEPDWLDANYLFYDENKQLRRVYVRDILDQKKMGYVYQKVENPWLQRRPKANIKKSRVATTSMMKEAAEKVVFPVKLDKVVKVLVDRPSFKRSKQDKEREEELLVIEGIEADTSKAVRFEVYVNDEDDKPDELVDKAEYAGGFGQVPHKNSTKVKSKIRLGLSELLEDLDIEDDDKILVSLVPRAGGEDITIGGIKIIYVDYTTGTLTRKWRIRGCKATTSKTKEAAEKVVFPVKLDKVVKVLVDRPSFKRSKKDKEREEELLVIEGIEADTSKAVRFEVYVNDEDDKPDELVDKAEYAGGFGQVPHKNSTKVKSKIRLGLSELLEDLDAEDDDKILVSLVPRAGGEDITIGGIKIIYVDK